MSRGERSRKQVLAWLGVAALSASCGGRASEPRKTNAEGASGTTSSTSYGGAGMASAGTGTLEAGGAQQFGSGGAQQFGSGGAQQFGSGGAREAARGGGTSIGGNSSEPGGAAGAETIVEGGVMLDVFSQTVDPTRACKTGSGLTYRIADTFNGHLVTNGTDGVVLSCKIVNHGDGTFELAGSISGTATAKADAISYAGSPGTGAPLEVPLSFTFASHGSIDVQQSDMTISYVSSDLGELEVPGTTRPCTLTATARSQGFLLADVDCPLVASPDDAASGCRIEGVVDFLYCDGE